MTIDVKNTITFVMDDRTPRPERRAKIAGLINKAIDDKAKAIVLDICYSSVSPNDQLLKDAFERAKKSHIPVFIGTWGERSVFSNATTVGHIMARARDDGSPVPNPNKFNTRENFDGNSYDALPALVALQVTDCGNKSKTGMDQLPRTVAYRDIPVSFLSYNDYSKTNMAGQIVFVGGAVAPETGNLEDVVDYDNGQSGPGVADLISAMIAYSAHMCRQE